ncbi:hypothetical protein [Mucilaginibacter lacusdianchii]|uniref:hypothetical protein n=1 Tax=Mucilaginibacter lacusdianchii TaxID=2684211 RepID=UPI00131E9118|nr:hypothetical protein [Mucilaginibacter sp. JXJ CY 39]
MKPKTVTRIINYFELQINYQPSKSYQDILLLFSFLKKQTDSRSKDRFVVNSNKITYLHEVKFDAPNKQISGKLLFIRTDVFPELMNTDDDKIRDIEAAENEGIIETTHFILSYNENTIFVSLEFNQYGPRISDFVYYLNHYGYKQGITNGIDFLALYRDDLNSYKERINRVSCVTAKIHKNNISRMNDIDTELFEGFAVAEKASEAEYVTLTFKYDYQQANGVSKIRSKVLNIIDKLKSDKNNVNVLNTLKVKAEDQSRNNKLKEFDLLNIWVKSEVNVEQRSKSRAIVSSDILDKMKKELLQEFNR